MLCSTQTEIVSVADCMPYLISTIHWLYAQGLFYVFANILYQDNKIAIILVKQRQGFKQQAHKAHKYQILFRNRSY